MFNEGQKKTLQKEQHSKAMMTAASWMKAATLIAVVMVRVRGRIRDIVRVYTCTCTSYELMLGAAHV